MHKAKNKHGPDTDLGIRRALARAAEVIAGKHPPWMEIRYGPQCTEASRGDPDVKRCRSGTGYLGLRPLVPRSSSRISDGCGKNAQSELPSHVPRWSLSVVEVPSSLVSQKERQIKQRARPRDFVNLRRTGESPPGAVNRLTINNIDSSARSKLPTRGRLKQGVLKDIYCLTATTVPGQIMKKEPRNPDSYRDEIPRKDAMTQRNAKENVAFRERMVSFRWLSESLDHRLEQMMDQEIRWLSEVETNRIDGAETNRIEEMNIGQPAPTVSFQWLLETLDHREKSLDFGRKLTPSCRPLSPDLRPLGLDVWRKLTGSCRPSSHDLRPFFKSLRNLNK